MPIHLLALLSTLLGALLVPPALAAAVPAPATAPPYACLSPPDPCTAPPTSARHPESAPAYTLLSGRRPLPLPAAAPPPSGRSAPLPAAGPPPLGRSAPPPGPHRPAPQGSFSWPLAGFPAVLRAFDAPTHPYGPGHRGVDLAGIPGQAVLSAAAGTVAFAGMVAGRPVVSVDHPNGLRTTYEPVTPGVTAGTPVDRGTPLGTLLPGHDGCTAPACLHWGVRRGTEYLDPLGLLGLPRIRLHPTQP
ncbi:MAG TPA: M23 family metallopeptidase [Pseudonocardiaceae bacterium]